MKARTEQEIMSAWTVPSKPLVSVCCTTYNHEGYISQAIDSFLMQETDFAFEIIVRDDCSTDSTAAIIKDYAERYTNIVKPIFESENQWSKGVKAMPIAIKQAAGKYLALCEGDDYWIDAEKLQVQVQAMQENPEIHMSFHPVTEKLVANPKMGSSGETSIIPIEKIIMGGGYFCSTPSLMFDRRAFESLPDFLLNAPVGDYYLQILGAANAGALYIDRVMSVYRVLSANSWSSVRHSAWTSTRPEEIVKGVDFYKSSIKSLDEVDRYYDNKFANPITQRKSLYQAYIAVTYLKSGAFTKFRKYIERSINSGLTHQKGVLLVYYLRRFPGLALIMLKTKSVFDKAMDQLRS